MNDAIQWLNANPGATALIAVVLAALLAAIGWTITRLPSRRVSPSTASQQVPKTSAQYRKPGRGKSANEFRAALLGRLSRATESGAEFVDVNSGDLHREVGDYPGQHHRMPVCCSVMRAMMRDGDEVVAEPPKGAGASLTIRYRLPR